MEQYINTSQLLSVVFLPLGGNPNICSLLDVGWDLLESEPLISINAI